MAVETRDIVIPVIIGLMVNLVSGYFFTLGKIDSLAFLYVLAGSLLSIVVLGIQLRAGKIEGEQRKQRLEHKKLNRRLKIYSKLANMKADIKELQRRLK